METLHESSWRDKIYRPYQSTYLFHAGHVAVMLGCTRRDVYRYVEQGQLRGQQASNKRWFFALDDINEFRRGLLMPELTKQEAWEFWEECDTL